MVNIEVQCSMQLFCKIFALYSWKCVYKNHFIVCHITRKHKVDVAKVLGEC